MAISVEWIKCTDGKWCSFMGVDLSHEHFNDMTGVYVIWHESPQRVVIRVGQGVIRDRLAKHREDAQILAYKQYAPYATWASVPAAYRDGVERYLAEVLQPKVGERFPDVNPIQINLPW